MQVPYSEGVANRADLESCAVHREVQGEALTKVCIGQPLSRERTLESGGRRCALSGRRNAEERYASTRAVLRGHRPWHVQKLLAREPGDLRVNRGEAVRIEKVRSRSR